MMDDPAQILEQVKGALNHWSLIPLEIELASQSENIVYKVTTAEGRFAFRIHRPGYHSLEELNSEHEWTSALVEAGFPIPKVRPTNTGESYLPISVNGGTRYAGVIEWLDGQSLFELERSDPSLKFLCPQQTKLGSMMAQLHNHSERWQHSTTFVRHSLDIDGFFGEAPFWGRYWESPGISSNQRKLLLDSQANIMKTLQELGKDPSVFGMIHADLHHGNVHISGDTMHLIDFDDAGFGWHLYDIAVALYIYQSREDYQTIWSAFLAGYETSRAISEPHKNLIPIFTHIRSRALIGWQTARPELKQDERLKLMIERTCQEAHEYS